MATLPSPRTWSVGEVVTAGLMNTEVRDAIYFLLHQPFTEITNGASQSIPNNVDTALTFNTDLWDTDGMHDTVTNSSRITATTSGIYLCYAFGAFTGNATGKRDIMFRHSGGSVYGRDGMMPNSAANAYLSTFAIVPILAGAYVEAMVYQNSGGALNIDQTLGGGQRAMALMIRKYE